MRDVKFFTGAGAKAVGALCFDPYSRDDFVWYI